jgi:hypothetical protein
MISNILNSKIIAQLTIRLMALKNKSLELQVKSSSELTNIDNPDDLNEEELVQLYYALEISKNNISKLSESQETEVQVSY